MTDLWFRRRLANPPPAVVVTGAAGQLGRAIGQALADRGAALLLLDLAADQLEAVRSSLPAGSPVESLVADVTDPGAPSAIVSTALERLGRFDVLVNNAGIEGPVARAEDVAADELRRVFEVNVFALFASSQAAVRHFRAQGSGRIVNMASGAGTAGSGLMAPYSASKHAVLGITRSLAREVADAGIQVNAVCPGCVESPMMGRIETRLAELRGVGSVSFLDDIPAGRYCRPEEVAEMVAWLALEAPDYINGAALVIDGAMRA